MLELVFSRQYKKAFKKVMRSGNFDKDKLMILVGILMKEEKLDEKYKDHALNGPLSEYRDCHVCNDLILIYKVNKTLGTLTLSNIGSHSDLFE
ncbi:MAG: type II toxin-antitoxin system mRNA interferase toxin, RelE/StbE family [Candidatus Paceibacterota bacterium]|jgi:mRNA interferase YafQ